MDSLYTDKPTADKEIPTFVELKQSTRKKKVVGLKRGPLSLVSTTEELLDRKVTAPV
jgi:hypothetical protein